MEIRTLKISENLGLNLLERIDYDKLIGNKDDLLRVEAVTPVDILVLWARGGDEIYDNDYILQKDLPYKWEDPLYMKMIHRLRNCGHLAAQFYHQIDPCNQSLFRQIFMKKESGSMEAHGMLEFMAWTSNMLGEFDIREMRDDDSFVEKWKKTPIAFFFDLDSAEQKRLVDRYNTEEIDAYNKMITDGTI